MVDSTELSSGIPADKVVSEDITFTSPPVEDASTLPEAVDVGRELLSEHKINELVMYNTNVRAVGHIEPGILWWNLELEIPGIRKKTFVSFTSYLMFKWYEQVFIQGNFTYFNARPDPNTPLEAVVSKPDKLSPITVEYQQWFGRRRETVGRFVTSDRGFTGTISQQRGVGTVWDIDTFASSAHVWDTTNVHKDENGHSTTSQQQRLPGQPTDTEQKVIVGLKRISFGDGMAPKSVYGYASLAGNNNFDITLVQHNTGGAALLGGALSWYFPPPNQGILVGSWNTPPVASTNYRFRVPYYTSDGGFPRPPPFQSPPTVLVWLAGLEQSATNSEVNVKVQLGTITDTGFDLSVSLNGSSGSRVTYGSWIAIDKGRNPNVHVGTISHGEQNSWKKSTGTVNLAANFGTVIAAFSAFTAQAYNSSVKINLEVEQVRPNGFDWTAETWGNGQLRGFEAMYICY